ncbi:MAG: molybdopterin-dependent oxidoreductase [Thalassobaculales bacterium]
MTAFTLNGAAVTLAGDPAGRLSDALRLDLGLTGTKIGCEAGDCGACTVLIDGRQACACLVPVGQVEGCAVLTVEGLAAAGLARLQDAFARHGAAQCGICTPGMLMAAAELLRRVPDPDEAAVKEALGGVLCRCTGYRKIIEAVIDAGSTTAPIGALGSGGGAIGTRLPRLDGAPKMDGSERYGDDGAPADALWLRAVRSPHHRAGFRFGDIAGFARRHGVHVFTAADVPGANSFGIYPDLKDQPVFAEGHVRHRGEAVAAIVGDRSVLAIPEEDFPVVWTALPPVTFAAAAAGGAPPVHASRPDNVLVRGLVEKDGPAPPSAFEATVAFETGFVEHAYIEPEAGWCRRVGARLEVHCCTQTPYMDRDEIARVLGLAPSAVRIVPTAVGGGFGGKLDLSIQPLLAVAAWHLGRPVRGAYTRPESMAATTKRHPARMTGHAACDATGRLTEFRFEGDFNTGAYASWGPTVANRVPVHATGPYAVPRVCATTRALYTNDTPAGAFRGFGVPQAALVHEALMDDLAGQAGIDRLAFRRRNAIRPGDATATGQVLAHSAGLVDCLDALAPRWQDYLERARQHNRRGLGTRQGAGIGCMWYGIGNTSLANPSTMVLRLFADGRLVLFNGAVDIGQGSATVLPQIAAAALGVPVHRLTQVIGDTDLTEDAGKTSASRQTFVSGRAAELAGLDLRAQILRLANAGEGAQIALDGAILVREGGREVRLPFQDLEGRGRFDPPTTPLDALGQGVPYATYGFAAQIALVEVDLALGTTTPLAIAAAHDVGRAINPMLVEGQIHGGIAQGLGLALMEEFVPGRTENLHDYLIPTIGDVPPIEVFLVEAAEPLGPYGAKGIGEPALIPTAPAILSAIRHATGARLTRVPVLPHRLREALR